MLVYRALDLPRRVIRRLTNERRDYRLYMFEHLQSYLGGGKPASILEIGPRDGVDTERLLSLSPERMVQAELPHAREALEKDLAARGILDRVDIRYGNIMYDDVLSDAVPFDLIWCAGVLYHNPEQLRMIARLYDWLAPGGTLVLETATARRFPTRNLKCVEIWHDVPKSVQRRYHLSHHITHLPSISAVQAWLAMAGFDGIEHSPCHRRQSFALSRVRGAFLCRRNADSVEGAYYSHTDENYPIGRAS
jgi:tRNA (mo5U34)-methyltransferase